MYASNFPDEKIKRHGNYPRRRPVDYALALSTQYLRTSCLTDIKLNNKGCPEGRDDPF